MIKHSMKFLVIAGLLTTGVCFNSVNASAQGLIQAGEVIQLLQTETTADAALQSALAGSQSTTFASALRSFKVSDERIARMNHDPEFCRSELLKMVKAEQADTRLIAFVAKLFGGDLSIRKLLSQPAPKSVAKSATSPTFVNHKAINLTPVPRPTLVANALRQITAHAEISAQDAADLELLLSQHPEAVAAVTDSGLFTDCTQMSSLAQGRYETTVIAGARASLSGGDVKAAIDQSLVNVGAVKTIEEGDLARKELTEECHLYPVM